MSLVLWTVAGAALAALVAAALVSHRRRQRAVRARLAWAEVARHCPPAPSSDAEATCDLDPRAGLAGTLAVGPSGLEIRPDDEAGLAPFLVEWAHVRHVAPDEAGSITVWTRWGQITLPSTCGRALWYALSTSRSA